MKQFKGLESAKPKFVYRMHFKNIARYTQLKKFLEDKFLHRQSFVWQTLAKTRQKVALEKAIRKHSQLTVGEEQ